MLAPPSPASPPSPPYTLPHADFPFRALTALAARAPLGVGREAALACLMVARLARGALVEPVLAVETRRARAAGARAWLSSLAMPAPVRTACARAADASAAESRAPLATALAKVLDVTASHLDASSVEEIRGLARVAGE